MTDPWKAASLSWLLPGLGQLYAARRLRAFVFFAAYLTLCIARFYVLFLLFASSYWLFAIFFDLPLYIFSVLSGLDASWCVKKNKEEPADEAAACPKSVWQSIFLTLVWPGMGHAYLKRRPSFILYSLLYLSILLFGHSYKMFRLLIRVAACIHIGEIFKHTFARRHLYRFIAVAALILFTLNFAIPRLRARYLIPGGFGDGVSMYPTMKKGDFMLISKFPYLFGEPRSGDIVQIAPSVMDNLNQQLRHRTELINGKPSYLVKRIAAVGGDVIQVKEDGVYVNGIPQKSMTAGNSTGPHTIKINGEKIERTATLQPYKVPDNCFFVLGDNVANSLDSRDFGPVPRDMIKGKIIKTFSPKCDIFRE